MHPRAEGPHVLVHPEDVTGKRAVVRGEDAHHLASVLRTRPGDPVSLSDGEGRLWQATVTAASAAEVALSLDEGVTVAPARPALTVVQALPKRRKLDEVVQRCSELGVDRIVPVSSARSQVELAGPRAAKAVARWRAVAHAAAKQSRRVRPLAVEEIGTWSGALAGRRGVVLWERAATSLRAALEALPRDVDEVVIAVGPEGGLTEEEVAAADTATAVRLGPTILRTETAPVVAAAAVAYHLGRLG